MRARSTRAVCCCVAFFMSAATIARGADAMRAGGATFVPPEGWTVRSQPDGLVRMISPDDAAAILVMPGTAFEGDLGEAFDQGWGALRQALNVRKVLDGGKPSSRVSANGYETVRTQAAVVDAKGNRLTCRYVVVRNGDAVCGMAYLGTPEAFKRFTPDYVQLSTSFKLGAAKGEARGAARGEAAPAAPARGAQRAAPARDATAGEDVDRGAAVDPGAAPAAKGKAAPEPPKLKPGVIAGRITDARGNVIRDARLIVTVAGTTTAGERTTFDIEAGEDGVFAQEVPDGLWRIYGFAEKEYNGRKYRLPLDPEDKREIGSTQGSRDGVVKNFVFKVDGPKAQPEPQQPGLAGGAVELIDGRGYDERRRIATRYRGSKLVISLQPSAPLIDGSRGRTLNFETDVAALAAFDHPRFRNIPLGEYVATARLVAPNGASRPINIAVGNVTPDDLGNIRRPPSPSEKVTFAPQTAVDDIYGLRVSVWE